MLLRLLLVGYLYGITSERRLLEEVKMHLAYRWFTRLGFEQEIPDDSTFSKNRHGRFRQCGVFRKVFEEIVRRCLEAGLVEGRNLAVDGTPVGANASNQSRVPREKLVEMAQNSRTVQEYLAELERQNPVADPEERPTAQKMVSSTDPDAAWAVKSGPATLGYYDNYLVDTTSRVILSVNATPARFRQEVLAARWMLERLGQFGVRPQNLAADKAYGSGEFLAWLLEQNIQPHIPVIDRRHQTQGHFTREQFRYEPKENAYYCPEGKALLSRSIAQQSGLSVLLDRSAMSRVSAEEIYVPRVSIEKYLFIGRSQRDKQFARWQVRLNISTLNERGTRSRPCSRSQAVATTQHRVTDVEARHLRRLKVLRKRRKRSKKTLDGPLPVSVHLNFQQTHTSLLEDSYHTRIAALSFTTASFANPSLERREGAET